MICYVLLIVHTADCCVEGKSSIPRSYQTVIFFFKFVIVTIFSNRRKNYRKHPISKKNSSWKFRFKNKFIEPWFINYYTILFSSKGALNWGLLFIFLTYMFFYCITCFFIPKYFSNFFGFKPNITVFINIRFKLNSKISIYKIFLYNIFQFNLFLLFL